jgi:hypothetical protein
MATTILSPADTKQAAISAIMAYAVKSPVASTREAVTTFGKLVGAYWAGDATQGAMLDAMDAVMRAVALETVRADGSVDLDRFGV